MTLEEKQLISETARKLIYLLDECDDDEFVDFVISCVASDDDLSLYDTTDRYGNLLM